MLIMPGTFARASMGLGPMQLVKFGPGVIEA